MVLGFFFSFFLHLINKWKSDSSITLTDKKNATITNVMILFFRLN